MPVWLTGKLIGYGVGFLLVSGIALKGYGFVKGLVFDFKDLNTKLANERIEKERTEFKYSALAAAVEREDRHRDDLRVLRESHSEQLTTIRDEKTAQKAVLEERERFSRLVDAKPGILQRLANKATQERFDELESLLNN